MTKLEDVKSALHIDGNFNDAYLDSLIKSAKATLLSTIGYSDCSKVQDDSVYSKIMDRYICEYVRGFYFQIDNQKTLDILQVQLQSLIEDEEQHD